MSKKTFFITLFFGVLFLASIAIIASKSARNQLLKDAETPSISVAIDHTSETKTPQKVAIDTSPLIFDTFTPNQLITSPLVIKGKAPGAWYFEASFPVRVEDSFGKVLGQGIAQAKSDWMTTELVPFEVKITFKKTDAEGGFVVFKKDNPSGDPKNDKEIRIPVTLKLFLQ